MSDLEGLLAGIVSDPVDNTRWLVLADLLQENDDPHRAELLRLHRQLLETCCAPDHPERAQWHARVMELLVAGARPCVPQLSLDLTGGASMAFSFIPPGRFVMGTDDPVHSDTEGPARIMTLTQGFYLGTCPVTQAQWHAVMGADPSRDKGPERPLDFVSWVDARTFCERVSAQARRQVRLPTEAEWEYACRAGTTTEYYSGDGEMALAPVAVFGAQETRQVGERTPNAWGLYDMHGNVWEWVDGSLNAYQTFPDIDPHSQPLTYTSEADRVIW